MARPRIGNQAAAVAAVRRASAGCLQQPQQPKQLAALIRTAQEGRRLKQPSRSKGMHERLMLIDDASIPVSPNGSENHGIESAVRIFSMCLFHFQACFAHQS